ncbi:MAG: hypothetical protein K2Q09_06345, partial [Phycisphaerales bacterium]|nr:hypothetical protein [Phycisphaerales bacterium]
QREEALGVLANRLLNSEERAVAMQAQLDRLADDLHNSEERAAASAPQVHYPSADRDEAFTQTRRRRLQRVREMLAQEHRKVLLAKEALGRHKAEADAVLQQRARLSQLAQSVQAAEAEANKARAKSTAASVIIAAMTALIAVGGAGYLGSGVLFPSAYAARTTLAAATDGREPTDDQKRAWLAAHERLAADPQVYTLAAEKFLQRGMRELANPAAVQERFTDNLALVAGVPGQVTIEHRGTGRENTARELETFAESLAAIANSRRETRADGMATTVVKPAEAGADPLDAKRQTAALASIGAGLLAAFAAGLGLYRLMARTARPPQNADPLEAFERSAPVGRVGPQRPPSAAA